MIYHENTFADNLRSWIGWMLSIFTMVILLLIVVNASGQEAAALPEPSVWDLVKRDILPQFITLLGTAIGVLIMLLKSKAGKALTEKWGSEGVGHAARWASDLAFELVMAGMQTTAKELNAALADGKITQEEYDIGQKRLKDAIVTKLQDATVGRLLGSGTVKTALEALSLNRDLVESAVKKAKAIQNP